MALHVVPDPAPEGRPSDERIGAPGVASMPKVRRFGLGYVWERPDLGVVLRADYLRERSDELHGEIVVESTLPGMSTHLHQGRINFTATRTKQDLAKHLATLTPRERLDWPALVEQFCVAVQRLERQGEAVVRVGNLPTANRAADLIERLLPGGKPTLWYGPQGVGKGWMSAAACVCHATGQPLAGLKVRQGRALYLDWEDDADTLNVRVQAVSLGLEVAAPDIAYRKCRRTLARDLHEVVRFVDDEGATLVVVDSVGLAAGAPGERGSYEDVALSLFDALRQLEPATVLLVDHVASAELRGNQVAGKAIGSIYKMAEARAAWEIRAQQEAGAEETHLGFFHTKHNHSQKYAPLGFKLVFAPSDPGDPPAWVEIHREDVRESEELRKRLPLADQIAGVVRRGPRHTRDVAEELGEDETKVRVILNRYSGKRFAKLQDGRWCLLATDQESPISSRPLPNAPAPVTVLRPTDEQWPG